MRTTVICCVSVMLAAFSPQSDENDVWQESKVGMSIGNIIGRVQATEDVAIKLLSDESAMDKRPKGAYYSIKYLEAIRSVKAVPVLCERLMYKQQVEWFDEIVGYKLSQPATTALIAIGHPAVHGLLGKIATSETTEKYREVAMDVLRDIIGKEKIAGTIDEFRVKKSEQNTDDQQGKLNFFKKEFLIRYKME